MNYIQKTSIRFLIYLVLITLSFTISAQKNEVNPFSSLPEKALLHTAYLIGDSGGLDSEDPPQNLVLSDVKSKINEDQNASIYFLGDNIYPDGLRDTIEGYSKDLDIIDAHIDLAESITNKSYMIPGNHDWESTSTKYNSMVALTDYLDVNSSNLKLKPKNGCPDPYVIKISKDHVFIIIDSQWWVDNADDDGQSYEHCDINSRHAMMSELERIFIKHKNDQITVLLHHPLMSNGNHGGKFSLKQHLFPLTSINPKLYFPLPILGSLLPIYRNLGINKQDVSYHWNRQLKAMFDRIISSSGVKRILFVSGHEHSQQLFSPDPLISKSEVHYLVSGSGYKQSYVRQGGNSMFVSDQRGYQKLYFYKDGSVWLDIISVSDLGHTKVIYRTELFDKNIVIDSDIQRSFKPLKDSVTVCPTKTFEVGQVGRFFVGDQYRDVWRTKVKVPVINLEEIKGGLTPVKLGGGASSNSLRLMDSEGKEYILRSVVKVYNRFLKSQYSDIIWLDFYGDENASALPYGTLSIGRLSDAIDLPHSDPKLYYLSHQEALGLYNDLLEEGLYMLENRPDGKKWKNEKSFGYASNIVSNSDMVKAVSSKATHKIDQRSVLKARLFDMWIHDWDRHDDQWRWSKSEQGKMTIYKPIPRDRDWVYFKSEGLIYSFIGKYVERKHSSFKHEISDIEGINMSPAHFDRANLNELEWSDWKQITEEMQLALTDDIIYQALSEMPKEILPIVKEEIHSKLVQRRNDLMKYSQNYYKILASEVSIVGTDNDDKITITTIGVDSTRVQLTAMRKKKADITKYKRTFSNNETEVIRVYGMEGEDKLQLPENTTATKIQFIGGLGTDEVEYTGIEKTRLTVFDSADGVLIQNNNHIKTNLNDNIFNNRYDRNEFKYNSILPTISLGSTFDEGLWLGAGFIKTFHGFRKVPFASKHRLSAKIAPFTAASMMLDFNSQFNNIGINDVQLISNIYYHSPDYINFFGLFNERNNLQDPQFNRVKVSSYGLELKLKKTWNQEAISVSIGPNIDSYKVGTDKDKILENYELIQKQYNDQEFYYGGAANLTLQAVNNNLTPSSGFKYTVDFDYTNGINQNANALNIHSDFVFYLPIIRKPNMVLAVNTGLAMQYGETDWFLTPSIGANNHLKSFRNDRFRGQSIYYYQAELRSDLISINNRYLPMDIGLTIGYEAAHAKYSNISKSMDGVSIGLSFNIGDLILLHPYYARAEKLNAFGLSMGYSY